MWCVLVWWLRLCLVPKALALRGVTPRRRRPYVGRVAFKTKQRYVFGWLAVLRRMAYLTSGINIVRVVSVRISSVFTVGRILVQEACISKMQVNHNVYS
ncbi:uncharacterized protein K460DRAFT_11721 [Cucurbitaria berberidis CBS 394.84]|uniref:Secreted protein n=1 Tax=Cucurbitaria berberidis CBS 394.84 TaxID=1168544 RepID=A0A9P4LC12_9PLEO|nr:uncharacterized protein K460DRAFT_11721 [Cucurbitaria berberidis CBS 394.84]KAF1850191.1 hypothetical protein K460DRAFT_11721 [Cucurbitaria berberidis CBS 394.84]